MNKIYKISLISVIVMMTSIKVNAGEIILDGIFQGKNLYVMNPFASSGVGFCVYEVKVNGQVTTDEINSSAFEIDLSAFQLKIGEKLTVEIKHKENCQPKILNPEILKPKSTFNVINIVVDKEGKLNWTTTDESGPLTFYVEQYRWNKWINVGTVEGKGTAGENKYSINVNLNSGDNRFRVKQLDYTKQPRYSKEAKFKSMTQPVTIVSKKFEDQINFSDETMYEIYDYYGSIVLKGTGKDVDISRLKKGKYFINFDNTMQEFTKK